MLKMIKYRFIVIMRNKSQLFWSLLFPLILGTLFYLVLGNISSSQEDITEINVAVVETSEENAAFMTVLEQIEEELDYFKIQLKDEETAIHLLEDGKIAGIIRVDTQISLELIENNVEQSILKGILDQYMRMEHAIEVIAKENPEQLSNVVLALEENVIENTEITLTNNVVLDTVVQYFYALIAMTCMFGSYLGLYNAKHLQADQSAMGIRRSVSQVRKIKFILSDFIAAVLLQFMANVLVLIYLSQVLKVDFGNKIIYIVITLLVGSAAGVALGTFLGMAVKGGEHLKDAVITGISLVLSFMAGLMISGIQDVLEHYAPLVNRINPAALIKDALYSLCVYDTNTRWINNMILLTGITIIMCILSALLLRREQYDSI